jgi:hypothetical protein
MTFSHSHTDTKLFLLYAKQLVLMRCYYWEPLLPKALKALYYGNVSGAQRGTVLMCTF